jgi:predicted RNA-binding protein with EMAP domain
MLDEYQGDYDAYKRAAEAIARARETEGVDDAGLWRTAVVESAAAITEALFNLAGSYQNFDPDDIAMIPSRLGDIADALETIAKALPQSE